MIIFGNRPGLVGTAVTDGALPFSVIIGGGNAIPLLPTPAVIKAAITGFKTSDRSAVGLAPTLQDRVYVWLFGEKTGVASISGWAFADLCGPWTVSRPWTGYDGVHSYFEQARAGTTGLPCRLVFGPNTTRAGFLEEFTFELEDPSTGAGTFSFLFRTIPKTYVSGVPPVPVWSLVGGG